MLSFQSIAQVLEFAIQCEQEAVEFYSRLATETSNSAMRQVFTSFAAEEMGHKLKLQHYRDQGVGDWRQEVVADLKIADYSPDVSSIANLSYEEALVVAMKKEKAAFRLYSDLADRSDNEATSQLFRLLAMEESKHKLRFEIEYDQQILKEN